ncbi:hypothetical protein EGI22_10430 [Lacihabitans sp. LS3-19]|uniref:3-coathanger stack domain-containing protein n=1 Tax=Lacihabitans sp. LS3-19 TaxID=2487335 RepID=UPI0020CD25B4|nr:3-coathanger stack domain-containing protein [Lacihabitans sp. LS3-19]MCP9768330.1 hypothetical protein [Lacihabitans sp. LS3-19]
MKNIFLIFFLFFIQNIYAQLHPEWVKSFEDIVGEEFIRSAVKDDLGNWYIAGSFKTTLWSGQKLESYNNSTDGFLAKYNANLDLLWVKRFGGEDGDLLTNIAYFNGFIYVTGSIYNTVNFNTPNQSGSNELVSEGESKIIAKYDTSGNFIWSKIVYGAEDLFDIEVNEEGIFLGGIIYFQNATLETEPLIGSELIPQGRDAFVAKYDLNGNLDWKYKIGGTGEDNLWDIEIHEHSLYMIGTYIETFSLNGFQTHSNLLSSPGVFESFVLKINTQGQYQWAKRLPGTNEYRSRFIQASEGAVYIGGIFEGTVNFNNPSSLGSNELISIGSSDLYVASFDTLGTYLWAKRFGSENRDAMSRFIVNGNRIILSASAGFNNPSDSINFSSPYVAGRDEITISENFLAVYNTLGTFVSAQPLGSKSTSITGLIPNNEDLLVVGGYSDSISFSYPPVAGKQTLVERGDNLFLAKYSLDLLPAWQEKAGIDAPTVEQSAMDVAYDDEGNSYVTGYFTLYVTFGNLPSTYGQGQRDMFVTKYGRDGKAIWTKRGGGTGNDQGNSIVVADGWVYVTGSFESVGNFSNPYNAGTLEITSAGGKDMFLARYRASDGVLFLITRGGGIGDDEGNDLHVLGSDLYLIGSFSGTANFNKPSAFGSNELVSAGSSDAFLAKYSTFGQVQWLRRMGGVNADEGTAVKAAGTAVYVGGNFETTANFNTPSATGNEIISAGEKDIYVARFSSAGNLGWVRRGGGSFTDQLFDLDFENNILYTTGFFEEEAYFPGPVNTGTSLLSAGGRDVFLSTYNSSGIPQWKKRAGGTANDVGTSVSVKDEKLFLGGVFRNTINFNTPSAASASDIVSDGLRDIFVAEYNLFGGFESAKRAGGSGDDLAQGMKYDGFSVYTAGSYTQKINFNSPSDSTSNYLEGAAIPFIFSNRLVLRPEIDQYRSEGTLGSSYPNVNFVKSDGNGNVYFVGIFQNQIVLGADTLKENSGESYYYLAKMDAFGKISQARILFDNVNAYISDLSVLPNRIALIGEFTDSVSFNYPDQNSSNKLFSQNGSDDAFLAVYNANGVFQWVKRAGGASYSEKGSSICNDGVNFYVAGIFRGTANFNTPFSNASNFVVSEGETDAFLVKYNTAGNVEWYKRMGGKGYEDYLTCQFYNNKIYITGSYSDSLNFNTPSSWTTNKLKTPIPQSSPFLACFDTFGNFQWSRIMGINYDTYHQPLDLLVNANGIFGLTLTFQGIVNFSNPYVSGQNELEVGPSQAFILSKFDLTGNYLWSRRIGGDATSYVVNAKLIQRDSELIIGGGFSKNINFNTPFAAGSNEILRDESQVQIFLGSFNQNGDLNWFDEVGSTLNDYFENITLLDDYLFMACGIEVRNDLKLGELTFPHINEKIQILKFGPCNQSITTASTAQDINTGKFVIAAKETNGTIEASNKISNDAEANYYAPAILLSPGFEAKKGVVFKAESGGCQ